MGVSQANRCCSRLRVKQARRTKAFALACGLVDKHLRAHQLPIRREVRVEVRVSKVRRQVVDEQVRSGRAWSEYSEGVSLKAYDSLAGHKSEGESY